MLSKIYHIKGMEDAEAEAEDKQLSNNFERNNDKRVTASSK